jgi:hypothetical protein
MPFRRHLETDGLTERVNNTFQQLMRCFCCYDVSNWANLLPKVKFAYNATRGLGIEHSPFEVHFDVSQEEPLDLLFNIRPSISVAQDASKRLSLLRELHYVERTVLHVRKDEMQARSEPSIAPHFARRDNVTVVTKNIFLRGQSNRKLRDRQLGPFTNGEKIFTVIDYGCQPQYAFIRCFTSTV